MDWLKENATWIRDILTIVFTLVFVIVAVLTYRRAKETFLQPLRSEVIKRQANKMSEILEFASESRLSAGDSIDYIGLCALNAFMWLDIYGFVLSDHEKLKQESQFVYSGFIQRETKDGIIHDIEVITPLTAISDKPTDEQGTEYHRLRYEKAKSGNLDVSDIDKIFLTKRHEAYIERLDAFARDPFLPSTTLTILQDFRRSIHSNVAIIMRSTIAEFIAALMEQTTKWGSANPNINPLGVYNIFNRKRLSHNETLDLLQINIRKYLKVDSTL